MQALVGWGNNYLARDGSNTPFATRSSELEAAHQQ